MDDEYRDIKDSNWLLNHMNKWMNRQFDLVQKRHACFLCPQLRHESSDPLGGANEMNDEQRLKDIHKRVKNIDRTLLFWSLLGEVVLLILFLKWLF